MTLTEIKELLAFAKKQGVTHIRVSETGAFEAVIQPDFKPASSDSFEDVMTGAASNAVKAWEE